MRPYAFGVDVGGTSVKIGLFDLAKEGDAVALSQVEEMSRLLGKALAAVSCVCDPEVICWAAASPARAASLRIT